MYIPYASNHPPPHKYRSRRPCVRLLDTSVSSSTTRIHSTWRNRRCWASDTCPSDSRHRCPRPRPHRKVATMMSIYIYLYNIPWGGGGDKIGTFTIHETKKKEAKINSVVRQHTRVDKKDKKTKPRPVASAAPHPTYNWIIYETKKTTLLADTRVESHRVNMRYFTGWAVNKP